MGCISNRAVVLAATGIGLASAGAHAATISLTPTVDVMAIYTSGGWTMSSGSSTTVQAPNQRGVLEFSLSSIPASATITRVTLQLDVVSAVGPDAFLALQARAYAGNGQFDPADAADGWGNAGVMQILDSGTNSVTLSMKVVQGLCQSSPYLGLQLCAVSPDAIQYAASTSSMLEDGASSPSLLVTYSVPEPSLPLLLGAASFPITLHRRRRQGEICLHEPRADEC